MSPGESKKTAGSTAQWRARGWHVPALGSVPGTMEGSAAKWNSLTAAFSLFKRQLCVSGLIIFVF